MLQREYVQPGPTDRDLIPGCNCASAVGNAPLVQQYGIDLLYDFKIPLPILPAEQQLVRGDVQVGQYQIIVIGSSDAQVCADAASELGYAPVASTYLENYSFHAIASAMYSKTAKAFFALMPLAFTVITAARSAKSRDTMVIEASNKPLYFL